MPYNDIFWNARIYIWILLTTHVSCRPNLISIWLPDFEGNGAGKDISFSIKAPHRYWVFSGARQSGSVKVEHSYWSFRRDYISCWKNSIRSIRPRWSKLAERWCGFVYVIILIWLIRTEVRRELTDNVSPDWIRGLLNTDLVMTLLKWSSPFFLTLWIR